MASDDAKTRPWLFSGWKVPKVKGTQPELALPLGTASDCSQGLGEARMLFTQALSSLSTPPPVKADALTSYLAAACPSVSVPAAGQAPPAPGAATGGAFSWSTPVLAPTRGTGGKPPPVGVSGDMAHLLLASAVWDWGQAAQALASASEQSPQGVPSPPVQEAFKSLRAAAGTLAAVRTQLLPILGPGAATMGDLSPALMMALESACLAEAQSLTLLRGIAKGHQASVVAGIALDTASLYGGALQSLSTAQEGTALPEGGSTSVAAASTTTGPFCCDDDMSAVDVMAFPVGLPRKLATYLKLKWCWSRAHYLAFSGMHLLIKDYKAGLAQRAAEDAEALVRQVLKLGKEYDKCDPQVPSKGRSGLEEELETKVGQCLARIKKDNEAVYYHKVPKEAVPADLLPKKQRVVDSVPLTLNLPPPGTIPLVTAPAAVAGALTTSSAAGAAEAAAATAAATAAASGATAGSTVEAGKAVHVDAAGGTGAGEGKATDVSTTPGGHASSTTAPSSTAVAVASTQAGKPPHESEGGHHHKQGGCNCCRCLVMCLVMPLLVMISLVGILVWIILLPLKCCCCPCGCLLQCMWDIFEWMIKAPLRMALWAVGSSWHPGDNPHKEGSKAGPIEGHGPDRV